MTPPDHDLLIEVRNDVKYIKDQLKDNVSAVGVLQKDYVSRTFLAKILGGFFSLFIALGEILRVYHEK